jgi:hypothetical protein
MQSSAICLSFPQQEQIGGSMPALTENTLPDITIFPNFNVTMRTPAGREYRGKVLEHDSQHVSGEKWYQVVRLNPIGKDNQHENAVLRQKFDKDARPDYFPERSNAEPLKLNLNRIPLAKRHPRNAGTLIGELWDADGLWTVLVSPTKSEKVLYAGSVLPAQVEVDGNPNSKISQYRQPTKPGELPLEAVDFREGQKPQPSG